MKKRTLFLLLFNIAILSLTAQVSINTKNVASNTVLHIDPKGDTGTSGLTNNSDDLIVSNTGSVGLGTIVPATKLDVNGKVRIVDGTQAQSHVLTALDNTGLAAWKEVSLVKRFSAWKVVAQPTIINANSEYILSGTTTLSPNTLGATTNGTSTVTIPPGNYLIILRGDMNVREYGRLQIFNNNTIIFNKYYGEYLGGATFHGTFTSNATLSVRFLGIDVRCSTCGLIPFMTPYPYQGNLIFWAELIILQL